MTSRPERIADETRGSGAGKRPRADARRNRTRVIEAAEAVFAAKGISASTEEVARAAGVGIGTVFRHFPTKEELLQAVFIDRLQRLADEADALRTAEDPGTALFGFFARVVEEAESKNALADALVATGVDLESSAAAAKRSFRDAMEALLSRAQSAGAVRDDVGIAELLTLLVGASRAAEHAGQDRDVQSRAVAVIVDGLRPVASP